MPAFRQIFIFLLVFIDILRVISVFEGQPALPGEFPSVVNIMYNSEGNKTGHPLCTGEIINKYNVLTAAHCIEEGLARGNIKDPQYLFIIIGDYDRRKNDTTEEVRFVRFKVTHPLYNKGEPSYDMTVLTLWLAVEFGDNVKPVNFPEVAYNEGATVDKMTFAGWGYTYLKAKNFSDVLQKYDVSLGNCQDYYDDWSSDDAICGTSLTKGSTTCHMDSGGGLFRRTSSDLFLHAILHGNDNCSADSPSIFVPLTPAKINWIKNVTYFVEESSAETEGPKDNPNYTVTYAVISVLLVGLLVGLLVTSLLCYFKGNSNCCKIRLQRILTKPSNIRTPLMEESN